MIRLNNVTKKYNNKTEGEVYALKDCTLSFDEKSFVIITGKSGSGKTTLINLIGSLDTPSSGIITYDGISLYSIGKDYRNKVIGFIFQEHNLFETLTVKENIRLSLELQEISVTDREIIDVLEKVSLVECIDKYPNELSTGQHQRCAIARALIKSPDVIIADEPTGSLDEKTGNQIIELLKKLSEEYLVIMVTHNLEYPQKYADRHIVLENGAIVKDILLNESKFNSSGIIKKNLDDFEQRLKISTKLNYIKKFIDRNKKHTIRSIIIFSLSISLIILFYTITNLNDSKIIYETINSDYSDKIYYINNTLIIDDNNFYTEADAGFFAQDIEDMKKEFKNNNILPIYRNKYISLEESVNIPNNLLFTGEISGMIEINNAILQNFDYDLIVGSLPKESSETHVEVAITKFLYEFIKEYGIGDAKVSEYKDILDKQFNYGNINYIITGVIDTKYNINYYNDYFLEDKSNIEKNKKEEYEKLVETEIHTSLFVPYNYIEKLTNESSGYFVKGLDDALRIVDASNNASLTNQIFFVSEYKNGDNIVWNKTEKENLDAHEVIIDLSYLNINQINIRINELISSFAQNHYHEISNEFEKQFPDSIYLDYVDYIISHQTNSYHMGQSFAYFQSIILREVMNEINSKNPSINISSIKGRFKDKVEVVGIDLSNSKAIMVSEGKFKSIRNISYGPFSTILVKSSNNFNVDEKILKSFLDNNNIENSILYTYYNFKTVHNAFYIYSTSLLIFFTLITVTLIIYFVNDLLKSVRKDIGLFLALGTDKRDIKQIYFIIISISMVISQIIGLIIFISFVPIVNSFIIAEYKLFTNVLYINFDSIIYTVVTIFILCSMFTYLSMMFILKKKSIKNLYYQ